MSNFSLPDSYSALEKIPAAKKFPKGEYTLKLEEVKSYFPTVTIPVDTILYRGDKGGARAPKPNMAAFFGNKASVGIYAAKDDKNISKYRVKKAITLLELDMNSAYDLQAVLIAHTPDGFLTEDEMELVYIWRDMETNAIRPTIPIGPKDASGHIPYLNRFMANLVCRLGFDGWIAFPYDPAKRQGLIQLSLLHGLIAYSPEVMVCAWAEHMEHVAAGGRRKTRRNRKAGKK